MAGPSLELVDVAVVRDGWTLLDSIDWAVERDERWVVLGRNGSGKTTLVRVASLYLHPSRGVVRVLGETLGRTDVRTLRTKIGLASSSLSAQLRRELTALDVVMTAKNGALEPWWHRYDDADHAKALTELERFGIASFASRTIGTLSSGEQQRVLLARTLMTDPGLVVLDEPTAGLDLGGREELVASLARLARDPAAPPAILVTHHVDEIPPHFTHVLMLRDGRIHSAGPIEETLTSDALGDCFGIALQLERRGDRFSAWAR